MSASVTATVLRFGLGRSKLTHPVDVTAVSSAVIPSPLIGWGSARLPTDNASSVEASANHVRFRHLHRSMTTAAAAAAAAPQTTHPYRPPPPNTYHGSAVYDDIDLTRPISHDNDADANDNANANDNGGCGALPSSAARNADPDAVHVVTGASRGMGLQFVQSLLIRTRGTVIAACRDPEGAEPSLSAAVSRASSYLASLYTSSSSSSSSSSSPSSFSTEDVARRLQTVRLDVTDMSSIDALASTIESNHGGRVDGLFNVAGVLGDGGMSTPGPERNISQLDQDWIRRQMDVNAIGPMMLTKTLAPFMRTKRGGKKHIRATTTTVVVNISARVGSISDNIGPLGWHSYRMSKAALNQGTRTMSHELKRQETWCLALYPGFTDTDMSKPFQKGVKESMIFPVDFTVGRLLDIVDRMEERHSGGFYDWAGQAIPF